MADAYLGLRCPRSEELPRKPCCGESARAQAHGFHKVAPLINPFPFLEPAACTMFTLLV